MDWANHNLSQQKKKAKTKRDQPKKQMQIIWKQGYEKNEMLKNQVYFFFFNRYRNLIKPFIS